MAVEPTSSAASATFDRAQLGELLPRSLKGWTRKSMASPLPTPLPGPTAVLQAEYTKGTDRVKFAIRTDIPAATGPGARDIHKVRRADGFTVAVLSLENGITITASSGTLEAPALEELIDALDLAAAAKLKRTSPAR